MHVYIHASMRIVVLKAILVGFCYGLGIQNSQTRNTEMGTPKGVAWTGLPAPSRTTLKVQLRVQSTMFSDVSSELVRAPFGISLPINCAPTPTRALS